MIQTTKVAHRTIKARDLDIFYRAVSYTHLTLPTTERV